MTNRSIDLVVLVIFVSLMATLHVWVKNNLISFFIWPIGFAALLPYAWPNSAWSVIALIVISELTSTLPPGVMTVVILVPFALKKWFSSVEVDISTTFFVLIAGTVFAQLLVIQGARLWQLGITLTLTAIWPALPVRPIIIATAFTSLVVWGLAILWQEIKLSRPALPLARL